MSHGNDVVGTAPPSTPCFHSWCEGIYCAVADNGERFHRSILSAEGGTDIVGVEIVANDHADGTSTGPQVDITFAVVSDAGVASYSAGLSPEAALRHAAAVVQAVSLALASR